MHICLPGESSTHELHSQVCSKAIIIQNPQRLVLHINCRVLYQKTSFIWIKHWLLSSRAYEDYKTVFGQGEDGRPHWVARKTCNYLTEAIDVCSLLCFRGEPLMANLMWQVCGNGLLEGGCMDEEKLAKHKDEQVICFERFELICIHVLCRLVRAWKE